MQSVALPTYSPMSETVIEYQSWTQELVTEAGQELNADVPAEKEALDEIRDLSLSVETLRNHVLDPWAQPEWLSGLRRNVEDDFEKARHATLVFDGHPDLFLLWGEVERVSTVLRSQ